MVLNEVDVTKRQATAFAKKNILTTNDVVMYTPKKYYDYRTLQLVKNASQDRHGIFNGELIYCDKRLGQKWYLVLRMLQDDGTNVSIMMFSETFRFHEFAKLLHKRITVCGKPQYDEKYGWSIQYPEHIRPEKEFVPYIEPVYTKIKGITDEVLLNTIKKSIGASAEPLDERLLKAASLTPYRDALRMIHAPKTPEEIQAGKRRILINDMLYFAEALGKADTHGTERTEIVFKNNSLIDRLKGSLSYTLTPDQEKILNTFKTDTASGKRFNTLIQGDVGCGKTIVAICMMITACENGYQTVLMAPREVLARQHYEEVKQYADLLGLSCEFLSSSEKAKEKREIIDKIATGETDIVVGTHSCIADAVKYKSLGLIITDEEHLFGVRQKELLEEKADEGVHSASMSATPIPRSLATVLYGTQKTVASIRTMPPGRLPVKTATQYSHTNVFPFMVKQIKEGRQCYVVCPAIEQNDEYNIISIEEMESVYRNYFKNYGISLGVVHGQMDADDVKDTIYKFSDGKLDILMSTTVIEVGVNVPNTTVMVVEQAERFGLASLHQLRGRVGRNSMQSYCILISKDRNNARLKTMVETNDGFEIAEADLQQRGSGDLLGVRQAGNNRFVNEMQKNPAIFQKAVEIVRYCEENGIVNHLDLLYGDNAESVGEDAE